MGKRIQNKNDLNSSLVSFMQGIIKIGASSKGDVFDETVRTLLLKELNGATLIDDKRWGSKSATSIFKEYRKRSSSKNFDFTDLPPLVDNGVPLDLVVVDKPNGSQNWPDLLIIYNQVGLPIEVKSTEVDCIVWNSGFPRLDSLYIFNCYGKSTTTCFLGQHAINAVELQELLALSERASQHNKKCYGNRWSYYVRDMYNSSQSFIESKATPSEIAKLYGAISEAEARLQSGVSECGRALSSRQKDVLTSTIDEKTHKVLQLESELANQRAQRTQTEQATLAFIQRLPWTSSQRTNFAYV